MADLDKLTKIAARLRWEAEAGLSAFRNLSVLGANEVAPLRLEGVIVELAKLDDALERAARVDRCGRVERSAGDKRDANQLLS